MNLYISGLIMHIKINVSMFVIVFEFWGMKNAATENYHHDR